MSTTIENQIHEFASALIEDVPIATVDSVTARSAQPIEEHRTLRRPSWLRGPALAFAVFAMTILVVVVTALAFGNGSPGPADEPAPTTLLDPAPTTTEAIGLDDTTSTTAATPVIGWGGALDWSQVELPIDAVTIVSGGDRIHAIGDGFTSIATTVNGRDWVERSVGASPGVSGAVAAWKDQIVTWDGGGAFAGEDLRTIRSVPFELVIWDGETDESTTHRFDHDGLDLAVGVGPPGVVVVNGSDFELEILLIQQYGRDDFTEIAEDGDDLIVTWADGTEDTVSLTELGVDTSDTGPLGWLSTDSATWIPIENLPIRFEYIVGQQTGFIGFGAQQAWMSSNGLDWTLIDGSAEGAVSVATALGAGVSFQTETDIVVLSESGAEILPSPPMRPYEGFHRPIFTAGGSVVALVDAVQREYSYTQLGGDWVKGELPDNFPEPDVGGWFTHLGVAIDSVVVIGVYPVGSEQFTDAQWWVGTP